MNKTLEQLREEARKLEDAIWNKEHEVEIINMEKFISKYKNKVIRLIFNDNREKYIQITGRSLQQFIVKLLITKKDEYGMCIQSCYTCTSKEDITTSMKEHKGKVITKEQFKNMLKLLKIDTLEFFI